LLDNVEITPAIDQIEFHPGQMQPETVSFCKSNGILVQAWSPLGTGRMLNNTTLSEIALKYSKSVAQLCIRWVLQNEILPLPKSVTPSRIKENADVFDFEISNDDMQTINSMSYFGGSGLNPDTVNF
jgi:diketogulonate reductase-like aldo/keto reductase